MKSGKKKLSISNSFNFFSLINKKSFSTLFQLEYALDPVKYSYFQGVEGIWVYKEGLFLLQAILIFRHMVLLIRCS